MGVRLVQALAKSKLDIMSATSNLHWKRPVSRIYHYNLEVGENYYQPMTSYLDSKTTSDTPGALSFSERLAHKWIRGRTEFKTSSSSSSSATYSSTSYSTTTRG